MTDVLFSNEALKELAKKFLDFKYIALDSDPTEYAVTQSAPITEITTHGGQRSVANTSHDSGTGVVTMTKQFVFSGPVTVKAICPMNNATAGQGVGLYRFLPGDGVLPPAFDVGGSLLVTIECDMVRPV